MQISQHLKAFTLVELIVVITIVWILSTVWFVSYSGYLTGARDSNRISQMVKLSDSLQVYSATKNLPLPDDYIQITASGALIWYQGYVGVDVLETIDYTNGWKDPKDDSYFTYYLSKDRNSMQLLALMEEQESVAYLPWSIGTSYALDYSNRFPKVYGKKLWILTQETTNTPAQEVSGVTSVDIVTENTNSYVAHISDTETFTGTGSSLKVSIPDGSCKRIKQMGKGSWNGAYTINPGGTWDVLVYCNMETSGGWWTLIARSVSWWAGTFAWGTSTGTLTDLASPYVYGWWSNLIYTQAMMATYSNQRNIVDTNIVTTSSVSSLSDGTHTLGAAGISWWTLTWQGMFFLR